MCVKASDCPCEHHGMLYPSGQIIQEDCNNWSDVIYYPYCACMMSFLNNAGIIVCLLKSVSSFDHFLIARVLGEYGTAQRTTVQVCLFLFFTCLLDFLYFTL